MKVLPNLLTCPLSLIPKAVKPLPHPSFARPKSLPKFADFSYLSLTKISHKLHFIIGKEATRRFFRYATLERDNVNRLFGTNCFANFLKGFNDTAAKVELSASDCTHFRQLMIRFET